MYVVLPLELVLLGMEIWSFLPCLSQHLCFHWVTVLVCVCLFSMYLNLLFLNFHGKLYGRIKAVYVEDKNWSSFSVPFFHRTNVSSTSLNQKPGFWCAVAIASCSSFTMKIMHVPGVVTRGIDNNSQQRCQSSKHFVSNKIIIFCNNRPEEGSMCAPEKLSFYYYLFVVATQARTSVYVYTPILTTPFRVMLKIWSCSTTTNK